jgi:hypothetical protein
MKHPQQPGWFVDLGRGDGACLLVAGTARSGTTWLGNVLAHATRSRPMFEPFLQDATFGFSIRSCRCPALDQYQPYLAAEAEPGEWMREVDRILKGKVRHWWCDRSTPPGIYRRRTIKAVRINLLLDHLAARRPALKILFVVRNPYSVVNSQISTMKRGWIMHWKPEYVLEQSRLMADWLEPYRPLIESSQGVVHRQAVKWCIENLIPLTQLPRYENVRIVRYEALVREPRTWEAVARFLADRHWNMHRFEQAVHRISPVALRNPRQIAENQEDLRELTGRDREIIAEVVREFGLTEFLPAQQQSRQAA